MGIAQALIHDPRVLILDEPTVGLDPAQIVEIRELIKSLRGEHTIMLSTHILAEVTQTCDGVVIINEGRLMASGSLEDLTASYSRTDGVFLRLRDGGEEAAALFRGLPGVAICARRRRTASGSNGSGAATAATTSPASRSTRASGSGRCGPSPWTSRISTSRSSREGSTMKNVWFIAKKELKAYFSSPIAYVVIAVFLLLVGFFFYSLVWWFNSQSMQMAQNPYYAQQININQMVYSPLFHNISIILLLMLPLLTMRLFAEEKKIGTEELLFTSPGLGQPDHPRQVPGLARRPRRHAPADRHPVALHLRLREPGDGARCSSATWGFS